MIGKSLDKPLKKGGYTYLYMYTHSSPAPKVLYSKKKKHTNAFTLIELLVVIAIIGVLASVVLSALNTARAKARDAKRLQQIKQVQIALEMYKDAKGAYPESRDCSYTFDTEKNNGFIPLLQTEGFLSSEITDPGNHTTSDPYAVSCYGSGNNAGNFFYFRYYPSGWSASTGCSTTKGEWYILVIFDMESSVGKHSSSPGFSCSIIDFQTYGEYVTGKYEDE
jgi:prepilin-type N-terminal cleavage/methylation domain-containing protein